MYIPIFLVRLDERTNEVVILAGEEIEIEVARLNNGEYEESTVTVTLSARPDGNQ